VFVGASQKVDIVAQQTVPAGESVGNDGAVRVTKVWSRVDVIDRGGEVVRAHLFRLRDNGYWLSVRFQHRNFRTLEQCLLSSIMR
jgi:hypothetical protein